MKGLRLEGLNRSYQKLRGNVKKDQTEKIKIEGVKV